MSEGMVLLLTIARSVDWLDDIDAAAKSNTSK